MISSVISIVLNLRETMIKDSLVGKTDKKKDNYNIVLRNVLIELYTKYYGVCVEE